jgi:hypothetical protein
MIDTSVSKPHQQQQQQQQMDQIPMMMSMLSTPEAFASNQRALVQADQFPDILQYVTNDQAKMLIETLAQLNNPSITNKQGASRGYTALHWICVRNELELIELLLKTCRPDVNVAASLGESSLFVCIK